MFGHLLLNQLPIFHICHGPHILPLPFFFFFFFFSSSRRSFLPIFGASAAFCIVLPFPWILSFHQWLAFLLNWTRSIYSQTKIQSLCALEGEGSERNRTCVLYDGHHWHTHTSYFQLSFLVIVAAAMAPLSCSLSTPGSKCSSYCWLSLSPVVGSASTRCASLCASENASLSKVFQRFCFFLSEGMVAYSA